MGFAQSLSRLPVTNASALLPARLDGLEETAPPKRAVQAHASDYTRLSAKDRNGFCERAYDIAIEEAQEGLRKQCVPDRQNVRNLIFAFTEDKNGIFLYFYYDIRGV